MQHYFYLSATFKIRLTALVSLLWEYYKIITRV